jgi:hypothetical protein
MATLREQFMSKSVDRRLTIQKKAKPVAKPVTCSYFSTPHGTPDRSNQPACGKPLFIEGQHGWLCKDHRLQQEAILESMRKGLRPNLFVDADQAVVDQILALEARSIARGQVQKVRFGSFVIDPVYISFWSANA